jgi:hypothetical protein
MIWSVIIYTPILLALAWAFGWLAMALVVVAFGLGIGVGAAWEDEQREARTTLIQYPPKRWRAWLHTERHAHRHAKWQHMK